MEIQYDIDSKECENETIDWSKNHMEYLRECYEKIESLLNQQSSYLDKFLYRFLRKNGNEIIKIDVGDLCHIQQMIVDSEDIIHLLNRIINRKTTKE